MSAGSGWAGLGGAPADFPSRLASEHSRTASTGAAAYSEIESTLDSGTVVRQYADANGTVFAISWSGPFLPDLRDLLGPRFEALAAPTAGRAPRGPVVVHQPDLQLVSTGHMGAFQGEAWLPGGLPAGFTPADIQ